MRHCLIAVSACIALFCARDSAAALIAPKTLECGSGEYVVGLTGRIGAWIDAIGPVCARWNERTFRPSAARAKRPSGGSGGEPNQRMCPAGSAIGGWKVESILQVDSAFTDAVLVQCQTLAPPNDITAKELRFGGYNKANRSKKIPHERNCPPGKLVTGINVWTTADGRFVADVDMRCGDAPFVLSTMTWQKQADGTVKYNSPTLKMRNGGDLQLDWCRDWATNCGAPAANAFCASKGAMKAVSFSAKPKVGLTVVIADKKICNAPTCQGFASIVCGPA